MAVYYNYCYVIVMAVYTPRITLTPYPSLTPRPLPSRLFQSVRLLEQAVLEHVAAVAVRGVHHHLAAAVEGTA